MTALGAHDYVVVGGGSAGCAAARRLLDGGATLARVDGLWGRGEEFATGPVL